MRRQGSGSHALTRRGLFRGLAFAGATTAIVSVLPGCAHDEGEISSEPVEVDEGEATSILDSYTEADLALEEGSAWSLPLGCVLHVGEGTFIPVTQAGASAAPVVRGCVLSTQDGKLTEVLSDVVGDGTNLVIYDVRCSDSVYAWVELDLLDHSWSLYGAGLSGGTLSGTPSTLWQADANYDPPLFACTGSTVLWEIMPSTSGDRTSEHSFCYMWRLGESSARAVVESPGRFATEPAISDGMVTLTPRVRSDEGVFYGITAYTLADDLATVSDQLVLPQTIKPFQAVRIGDRFAFSVEATYSSGGLFANMGTYIGSSAGPFLRLAREPSANVAGKDSTLIIKNRASYFVVDTSAETYAVLGAANRCLDYGEYPARAGTTDAFVTYAAVKDADTGYPASVTVRTFNL